MSNVASLELCTELLEVSGWLEPMAMSSKAWHRNGMGEWVVETAHNSVHHGAMVAYNLGFLLRKLPPFSGIVSLDDGTYAASCADHPEIPYDNCVADNPEDAACKLAIQLFKQGILTKELIRE